MNKKLLRSPLKILAATSVTLFSLLAVFTSTAAWFDSRRTFDNGANQMEIQNIYNFKELNIYVPLAAGGVNVGATDVTYSFESTPASTYTRSSQAHSDIPLGGVGNHYSTLDPYHPLLMIIEYESVVTDALYIRAKTTEKFICPADDDDRHAKSDIINGSEENYPLSSVIHFSSKCYPSEDDLFDDQLTSESWQYSRNTVQGDDWQQASFASVTGGGGFAFEQQIEVCRSLSRDTMLVAIVLEYDIEVVSAISAYYMGEEFISNSDTFLPFFCDWTMEI